MPDNQGWPTTQDTVTVWAHWSRCQNMDQLAIGAQVQCVNLLKGGEML